MNIRPTEEKDIPRIMEIYDYAKEYMRQNGNATQWLNGYPTLDIVKADIAHHESYVIDDEEGVVHGVFVLAFGDDPTYVEIYDGKWLNNKPYACIHRIAGDGTGGIFRLAMDFCKKRCNNLRIDTHHNNKIMQYLIETSDFKRCGIIHIADGTPRIAYQWEA